MKPSRLALPASLLLLLAHTDRVAAAPAPLRTVIVVFKTHFDIGYTDMARNVVQRYRTSMIDQALDVVGRNRDLPSEQQFVWTLPGWPLAQILADWPGQSPERRQRVMDAFERGRFVVHALPFTTHTESLEPEDLVRGLGFASHLSRAAHLELPRDAKMTDVPCHSWILPTLLRHAGVEFLHLGCNAASRSPEVPTLFWWEGPDGSRLLTMYTAESYGTGLVPPPGWPHPAWLALIHTGDNHGPPTPEEVKQLREEARVRLPGVAVRIGRLSDFADAVLAGRPDLPVIRGDMPDTWIHGPMSDPAGAALGRTVRPMIAAAEALGTELRVWDPAHLQPAPPTAAAYEQSLLYGEHTWGGALYWVTKYGNGAKWGYGEAWTADHAAGRFQRLEDSWAEHTAYIEKARDLTLPSLTNQLRSLAQRVATRGARIVVYNPLPWRRSGLVAFADAGEPILAGRTEGSRAEATAFRLAEGVRRALVRDIPPLGYRTYELQPGETVSGSPMRAAPDRLESPYFQVRIDPRQGVVRSLVDRRTGRELVAANASPGFGQFLYERFSSNEVARFVHDYVKIDADWATNELGKPNLPPASLVPYRRRSPAAWTAAASGSPDACSVTLDAPAANGVAATTLKVTVYRQVPVVDLELTLHDKPADPWPEAGWLCLPFNVVSPQFKLGRPGSVIDPARDIVRGANRHLLELNTGLTISDRTGRGAGMCALDNPLVSLGGPGCWKYSRDFTPTNATVYVNLFNNQWTTNFRLWNSGTWKARVRIWSVASAQDTEASLITPSLEARYPLLAARADGPAGPLPQAGKGLELSRRGVLVSAFGPNPDGAGTLLRLWEMTGRGGACRIRLPSGFPAHTAAQPVDLRGQPRGPAVRVKDGSFATALRAFAPATFVLLPE